MAASSTLDNDTARSNHATAKKTAAAPQPPPTSAPSNKDDEAPVPLAAQIPLQDFTLPIFPPEAAHLRELTLTADIKMDDYQTLVQEQLHTATQGQPPLPTLPTSITHLTLELFGLGFPGSPPFLTRLARSLPNLRSVTFFSCLIDGLDEKSRRDAERFFEVAQNLNEVHFIDAFARPGFFKAVGNIFEQRAAAVTPHDDAGGRGGLKVVDASYTFRGHEDSDFLARIQGEELSGLIVKGVVGASFSFVPVHVDELDDEQHEAGVKGKAAAQGVLPYASDGRAPAAVKKRFESLSARGELTSLRVLNLSMWSLRPVEVGEVLYACAGGGDAGLVDLTVSVLLEEGWLDTLVDGLKYKGVGAALEGLEIVGVPVQAKEDGEDWHHGIKLAKAEDLTKLGAVAPKLIKFEQSILKVKNAEAAVFTKENGEWKSR